jgi:hypothetical protein
MTSSTIAAGAAFALLIAPAAAEARDTICAGVVTGVHDNVIVPAGTTCGITNARIRGNVKISGGADIFGAVTIGGNIDAEAGNTGVRIYGGPNLIVEGNVTIKKGALSGTGYLAGTQIGGNFHFEENLGFLVASGGQIGGNLTSSKNFGGGGIFGNTIQGNLECKDNDPPHGHAGNTVGGNVKCPE